MSLPIASYLLHALEYPQHEQGCRVLSVSIEFLQASPYFSSMTESEIESISGLFYHKTVDKGDKITWEGDPGDALYFVVSGAVKCFKTSPEGKEQILQIVLPGNSFNDVAVFDGGFNPTSTEAMSLVNLYVITRSDVGNILSDYPKIMINVIDILSIKIRHLLELVEDLSFRQVIGRIARILLEYADGIGPKPKLTQNEMAALAGTAREVVGRSLKLQKRATPLTVSGSKLTSEEAINLARIANRTRGSGAGKTVWDMAKTFDVSFTDVTWKMLDSVKHRPIVIIRHQTQ